MITLTVIEITLQCISLQGEKNKLLHFNCLFSFKFTSLGQNFISWFTGFFFRFKGERGGGGGGQKKLFK